MTLSEIWKSDKDFLIVRDIAKVVGFSAEKIRDQAMKDPKKLGFPVVVVGAGVRIPRKAFLHWMEYGNGADDI